MNDAKPVKIAPYIAFNHNSVAIPMTDEMVLSLSWFPRKGHLEETPLTDEDRAEHARAVAAYEEVMSNPWITLTGYDYEFEVDPLEPRKQFVSEETREEHMARWIAAGRPMSNPFRDAVDKQMLEVFGKEIEENS